MIDLLLENPAVIGVIIFFLWRLFRPSKEEQKQVPKRKPMTTEANDPYKGNNIPEVKRTDERKVERRALTTTSAELEEKRKKVTLTQSSSADAVTFDYAKEQQKLDERKKQAQESLNRINQATSSSSSHSKVSYRNDRHMKPTQAQLREGIIWAEILGKPKARRNIK